MYVITHPTNGMVVRASDPQNNIVNFTQRMINDGEVLFVHKGLYKESLHVESLYEEVETVFAWK